MAARVAAQEQQEEALKMFRLFDIDATGRLTYTDVRRVAHDLSAEFDEAELQVRRRTAHMRSILTFLVSNYCSDDLRRIKLIRTWSRESEWANNFMRNDFNARKLCRKWWSSLQEMRPERWVRAASYLRCSAQASSKLDLCLWTPLNLMFSDIWNTRIITLT